MVKLLLAAALLVPAMANASQPNPEMNEMKVENVSGGKQRLCIRVYQFANQDWRCSQPFAAGNASAAKLLELHAKARTRLEFSFFDMDNFTVDRALVAVQSNNPELFVKDAPCIVSGSRVEQVVVTGKNGKKSFARQLVLSNLRLPGSANVNKSVSLDYDGDTDRHSQYSIYGNHKGHDDQKIEIVAKLPLDLFEGNFLPETLVINIRKDSGAPVETYSCKVQNSNGTSSVTGDATTGEAQSLN